MGRFPRSGAPNYTLIAGDHSLRSFYSRLSRQELYSYGFKEGQPWGELALREMDQLERELHGNYIYSRPAYSRNTGRWLPPSASRHYWGTHVAGRFPSPARSPFPQAVFSMNRSDGSDSHMFSDGTMAPWSDHVNGYVDGRSYHDSPGPSGHFSAQSGRQGRDIDDPAERSPPAFDRLLKRNNSPQISLNYASQLVAPPLSSSTSSYGKFRGLQDLAERSELARHSQPGTATHSLHSRSPLNAPLSSSQMQLVTYGADRDFSPRGGQANADHRSPRPTTSSNGLSSGWSVATTRGTGSESFSMDSFEDSRSGDSISYADTASCSSGYAESYDVRSHDELHYDDYRNRNNDESETDQDFMSDGVASDEGVYYSSSEAPEYEYDGDEVYSDGGYSSFSEGNESYGDSE